MGRVERRTDLPDDSQGPPEWQSSPGGKERLQIASLDARHRDVEEPVLRLAGVVDGDDARMVERRSHLRLPQEALAEVRLPHPGRQELQRGLPPEADMFRPIDDARAALAERLPQPVAAKLGPDATV